MAAESIRQLQDLALEEKKKGISFEILCLELGLFLIIGESIKTFLFFLSSPTFCNGFKTPPSHCAVPRTVGRIHVF